MIISLRKVVTDDCIMIYNWKNDSFIREMALDFNYETTIEQQKIDIEHSISSKESDYQIILLNNKTPIGYIRIDWIDDFHKIAWLRFALGNERGKGYSTIALRSYISSLIKNGCHRIEGEVYEFNSASQHVLENIGFKKEGIKRKAHFMGSDFCDIYVYGLLAKDLK